MTCALVLIAAMLTADPVVAADGRLVGQGAAPGVTEAAFEQAAAAAKQAIVAGHLARKTGMDDLSSFAAIIDRAEAYLHSSEIVGRYEVEGGTRVELAAGLFEEDLERDMLRLLEVRARGPSSVLVVLVESTALEAPGEGGEPAPESAAGLLAEAIEEEAWQAVTLNEAAATPEEAAALAEGEAEALANLGAAHFAEAVAAGVLEIEAQQREGAANVFTVEARMTLRVVQVRSGILCEEFEVQRRLHCAEPQQALSLLRKDCIESVKDNLRRALLFATALQRPPDEVQIELDTAAAPESASLLWALLEEIPLVEEVEIVLDTPQVSRLRMRYGGPLAPLTDTLTAMAIDEGVFFDVRRVVGKDVAIAAALLEDAN